MDEKKLNAEAPFKVPRDKDDVSPTDMVSDPVAEVMDRLRDDLGLKGGSEFNEKK